MKFSIIFVLVFFLLGSGNIEARKSHQDLPRSLDVKQSEPAPTKQPGSPPTPTPTKTPSFWGIITSDNAVREFLNEPSDDFKASPSAIPTHKPISMTQTKRISANKIDRDYLYTGILLLVVVFFLYRIKRPTL